MSTCLLSYRRYHPAVNILSYLGIAAEVARSKGVGRCDGGSRGYGRQGAIWSSSSTTALFTSSLILTGPATSKDPAPQRGRAAGGAARRVTGRTRVKIQRDLAQERTAKTLSCFITTFCSVVALMSMKAGIASLIIPWHLELPTEDQREAMQGQCYQLN